MCPVPSMDISRLLDAWGRGDEQARDALIPVVYDELRRLARAQLRRERPDHTLQSAALVNEAYLRLIHQNAPRCANRAQFFGLAAHVMRNVLVDHARNRLAAKRGARAPRLALDPDLTPEQKQEIDLVSLDIALAKLATMDAEQSRLVELRFLAGFRSRKRRK